MPICALDHQFTAIPWGSLLNCTARVQWRNTNEKELIGLVKAVHHWRPYLRDVPRPHQSLQLEVPPRSAPLHDSTTSLGKQALWLYVHCEYQPGKHDTATDALSRCTDDMPTAHALSEPQFNVFDQLRQEVTLRPALTTLRDDIRAGHATTGWSESNRLLLFHGRVHMTADSALWPAILVDAHSTGHEGTQKTLQRLHTSFHVPGLRRLVQDYVRGCSVCQCNQSEHLHPAGLLQPLPITSPSPTFASNVCGLSGHLFGFL